MIKIDDVKPTRDQLWLEQDATEKETEAGIILTKETAGQKNTYTILAVGPDVKDDRFTRGVRVVGSIYGRIPVDGMEKEIGEDGEPKENRYWLLPESLIYAIIGE